MPTIAERSDVNAAQRIVRRYNAMDRDWDSDRVRALRKRAGFSQKAFALHIGVSKITITRWENDWTKPRTDAILNRLVALETSLNEGGQS